MKCRRVFNVACMTVLAIASSLRPNVSTAQQVATDPASTHIFPAGGRRGSVVSVRVGGECLPPQTRIRWETRSNLKSPEHLGPRAPSQNEPSLRRRPGELHINYPKEWQSQIDVSADVELGAHYWWLASARGGTGARPFLVGDLPEHIERESNSNPDLAETLSMPIVVNGQIDGERDQDYFQLEAQAGDVVVLDVMAARIGSPLEAVVDFRDASGRRLTAQEVRVGSDPVFAVRVSEPGRIGFSIANLSSPGGPHFVYRATLSSAPYARLAFPGGGKMGTELRTNLLTLTGGKSFVISEQALPLPNRQGSHWWTPAGMWHSIPLSIGAHTPFVEHEPNDERATANSVELPVDIHGRLQSPDDEDWIQFSVEAGKAYALECQPAGNGLSVLPILSVHDAAGATLAIASAIHAADRHPCIEHWAPPAAGQYWLRVRDVQQGVRGGDDFVYRTTIQLAQPDFELSLKTDSVNHVAGGRSEIDLAVRRRGGFAGPIVVRLDGLPEGVRAEPLEIPGNAPTAKLIVLSEPTAPPNDVLANVTATAMIGESKIEKRAIAPILGRDPEGVAVGPGTTEFLHLTVQTKPLFRLYCSEAYQYAHRGSVYKYLMQVDRFDGFNGPITLQIADRQNKDLDGIEVREVTIPGGDNQVMLPIFLPETMHINVQAHSNVYAQGIAQFVDRLGRPQSTCVVSEMRCMIRTLPTAARLQAVEREFSLAPGGQFDCHLRLDRTPLFSGNLVVEAYRDPDGLHSDRDECLIVEPVTIPAGQRDATVVIRRSPNSTSAANTPTRPIQLCLRGTGSLEDGSQLVTDAMVTVRTPDAASGLPQCDQAAEVSPSREALWDRLGRTQFFQPPPEFAEKLGTYRSPLTFADGTQVRSPEDWARRRKEIEATWRRRLGPWPPLVERPAVKRLESVQHDGYVQHHVHVQISPEGKVADGYLLVPTDAGPGPFPAVLVPFYEPQTSIGQGTKGRGTHDYGLQLVRRGFVTLSIGTPGSVEKIGLDTRQLLTEAGIEQRRQPLTLLAYVAANCHTALAQLPEVAPDRIGIIGLSYGGKWSMFASCLHDKFACAVWSDPGIVFDEKNANVNYWEPWYLGYDARTQRQPGVPSAENPRTGLYKELVESGEDLVDLHALMAPRPLLVSGGTEDPPRNWQALNHLVAVNALLGHQHRVAMTSRSTHVPTASALEWELTFLEYWLKR